MSKPDIWMPLFIGDYLSSTSRLTCEQHGAYLLLIMDYWKNGPPPNDDAVLAQICRMSQDAWSNASSIIKGFFVISDNRLNHNRIDIELEAAKLKKHAAKTKAEEAAKARWDGHIPKHASSNATSNQQAMLGSCPSPSPLPLPSLKSKTLSSSDDIARKKLNGTFEIAKELLEFLNKKTGKGFRPVLANLEPISARLKEGFSPQDIKTVIARKCMEWGKDDVMSKYLRPATLFNRSKFAQYNGECVTEE